MDVRLSASRNAVSRRLAVGAKILPPEPRSHGLRCFKKHGIVQQIQSLERSRRSLALRTGHVRVRRIEHHQLGIGNRALKENVETTTISFPARTLGPFYEVAVAKVRQVLPAAEDGC